MRDPIDWDAFIELAGLHGVLPVVYRTFYDIKPAGVPQEVSSKFQKAYQQNAAGSLRLVNLLIKTLDRFDEQQIRAFPFRGPVLSYMLHGDAAMRQCGDLDLIIRRDDLEKAKALLLADGFELSPQRTSRQEALYIKYFYSLTFVRDSDRAQIDLHWNITSPAFSRYFDFDEIAARSQTISLSGRTIPVFSPMDWLLSLSMHAAKHMWSRLLWLNDIQWLLKKESDNIDWRMTMKFSQASNDTRLILVTLILCRRLLGLKTNTQISEMENYTDKTAIKMANLVLDNFFSKHDFLELAMWKKLISYKTLNHIRLQKGWRAKTYYIMDKTLYRSDVVEILQKMSIIHEK